MSLFRLVVDRPVAVWMVALAAIVFGRVSYERLPLNLMPDLAYPSITVRTEVDGYAPQEVESQISRPVEEALATVPGLSELESRSRAGSSDVLLEFRWGADMDDAAQTVRERLQTTFLPEDADRPLILRYDPSQEPVMRLGLSLAPGTEATGSPERSLLLLREEAERTLKKELEALDGVAAVRVRGGLSREIRVEAREDWLAARSITIDQLTTALGAENVNLPGGSIRDGDQEFLVRTLNEVRTVEEIRDLEIRRADGVKVPVRDLAVVREAHQDREVVTRLDGRNAVELEIFKAADANIVRVAEQIQTALNGAVTMGPEGPVTTGGLRERLPKTVQLVELENQARFIGASLDNLFQTAVLGAFLAVVILFAFLRDFRATAIIGAAIPLSIIVTFAPMYMGGVSLNLMSLGGLALGIGMLVDNAVVVLENIQVYVERGASRRDAAVKGTADVAAAVTASTLTTVSVFLPIAFVEGVAGQIFGDLALAVVFSLLASLAVALLFVPMLAAREISWPDEAPKLRAVSRAARFRSVAQLKEGWRSREGWRQWAWGPYLLGRFILRFLLEAVAALVVFPSAFVARGVFWVGQRVVPRLAGLALAGAGRFQQGYERLARRYDAAIPRILGRPGLVLGIALASVLVALPMGQVLGQALIPELHQGRFTAELALPVGTPLSRTVDLVAAVERGLVGHEEIAHLHSIIGTESRADSRSDEGEHTARVMVELTEGGDLEARETALMEVVRGAVVAATAEQQLDAPPELRMVRPSLFSFSTPVEVVFFDDDLDRLREVSARAVERIAGVEGLTDVRSSMVAGFPEVQVRYDRDLLRRYNLDTGTIANRVRNKVLGRTATSISRGDGRVDLVVRLEESDRRSLAELERINVNPELVPVVPLGAVASFAEAEGPSEIRRIDQRRVSVVTANVAGFDIQGQAAAVAEELAGADLSGVQWEIAGQAREMGRSLGSLQMALGLAVFLVYVIMASTFESVLHPFVILFSVPLAIVGVVFALAATATPVSVVVLIGSIVLAGVVVNNAIVLVDTINRERADGKTRLEAIADGAKLRLRPILITTLTTVLGLLPLAFGVGEGAEVQQPLALTIIAGLSSSTLLTLAVIPVVYRVLTKLLEPRSAQAPDPAESGPSTGMEPAR